MTPRSPISGSPKADQFVKVEALPYLGSGKLDLKAIKRTAADLLGAG